MGSAIKVTTHYYPIALPILKEHSERITAIWVVWVVSLYLLRFKKQKTKKFVSLKVLKRYKYPAFYPNAITFMG
jgi:hypothetical protein